MIGRSTAVADETFRVLVVCTANLCRSPMAEYLLRSELSHRWPAGAKTWAIGSAGIHAESGAPIHPRAGKALGRRNIDTSEFRSRRGSQAAVEEADLILTATREHRSAVVTLVPAAVRRTFTLGQFARMASAVTHMGGWNPGEFPDGATAGRALLEQSVVARSTLQPIDPSREDVADPIGRRMRAFRRCADRLAELAADMMSPLSGAGGR